MIFKQIKLLFSLALLLQMLGYFKCEAAREIYVVGKDPLPGMLIELDESDTIGAIKQKIYDELISNYKESIKLLANKSISRENFWKSYILKVGDLSGEEFNLDNYNNNDLLIASINKEIEHNKYDQLDCLILDSREKQNVENLSEPYTITTYSSMPTDWDLFTKLVYTQEDSIGNIKQRIYAKIKEDNSDQNIGSLDQFWNTFTLKAERSGGLGDFYLDDNTQNALIIKNGPLNDGNGANYLTIEDRPKVVYLSEPNSKSQGSIPFEGSDSIGKLKSAIAEKYKTHADSLRLIFNNKQLEERRTGADYGIKPGLTIFCHIRNCRGKARPLFDPIISTAQEEIQIAPNSQPDLKILPIPTTTIFLKTVDGKTLMVRILPTTTVGLLKSIISEQEKIPADRQALVLAGQVMEDHKYLFADYNILKQNNIFLIIKHQANEVAPKPVEKEENIIIIKPAAAPPDGNELEPRIFQLHQALVQLKQKLMTLQNGLTKIAQTLSGIEPHPERSDDIGKRIKDLFDQAKNNPETVVSSDAESVFSDFIVNINSYKNDPILMATINASIIDLVKISRTFLQDFEKKVALKNALMTIQSFLQTFKRNNLIPNDLLDLLKKERPIGNITNPATGNRHIQGDIMEFIDAILNA